MSDRVTGLLFLVLAVWYGYTAQGFEHGQIDPLGPVAFPTILAVLLVFLGTYLVVRPDAEPDWVLGTPLRKQVGTVGTLVGYAALVQPIGFIWSTFICSSILASLLGAGLKRMLLTGFGLSFGFFFLFDRLFELPLPSGAIGELLTQWTF